jgi:hypothetical protein
MKEQVSGCLFSIDEVLQLVEQGIDISSIEDRIAGFQVIDTNGLFDTEALD